MRARILGDPHVRPFGILLATIALLAVLDGGEGRFVSIATVFSTLQWFATLGLVALGLGMSMMIREFDLSVAGMLGLAGCVAVMTGARDPWLGVLLAMAIGVAAGVAQGLIMAWLKLGSIGVTLGGLLTFVGIAFVLTDSRSIPYPNIEVALSLNERIGGVFSIRILVAMVIFIAAAAVIGLTRLGRDIIAIGSDRRAAIIAGVNVNALLVGTFAFSGALAALSGALLSYSLASASPSGLSDVLVPGAAAAILGGVSLSGGTGRPLGIAAGVLTLSVLRSGLNALGVPPSVHDVATGAILLAVAILDGPAFALRLGSLRRALRRPVPPGDRNRGRR